MSNYLPQLSLERVRGFLGARLEHPLDGLRELGGGEHSQAFSFDAGAERLVLRVSRARLGFEKDRYAGEHFASTQLPVPRVKQIGQLEEGLWFAISERAPGSTLQAITRDQLREFLPTLLELIATIHETDVSATVGYGRWGHDGRGPARSWRAVLDSFRDPSIFDWERWISDSFLERSLLERLLGRVEELAPRCPEFRHLIHCDLGGQNLLAEDGRVTAVLDWGNSWYGDFAFDYANLTYQVPHPEELGLLDRARASAESRGMDCSRFESRIRCYEILLALIVLDFYCASDQADKYRRATAKAATLLQASST